MFKGQFESEKPEEFISKLQEILVETDTTFLGNVESFEIPPYVDFQKVEAKTIDGSDSEGIGDKSN